MTNVIKEFMDMKPGQRFLHDVGRIATALERIADALHGTRAPAKEKPPPKQKEDDG